MRPSLPPLASIALLALASTALAVHDLPRPSAYVSDFANVLSPQEEAYLESLAVELERNTTAELAVVTVPSLEGMEAEQYSIELAEKWKVGKKGVDNGVILLLAPAERRVRIEVGYGLEGALTDVRASRIIREKMIPHFSKDAWFDGLRAGAESIAAIIGDEAPQGTAEPGGPEGPFVTMFVLLWLFICTLVFGVFYSVAGAAKPPVGWRKPVGYSYGLFSVLALALAFIGSALAIGFALLAFLHVFAIASATRPGKYKVGGVPIFVHHGGLGRPGGGWGGGMGGGGFGGGFGGGGFGGGGAGGRF
jgi:uncharacterized protein